MQVVQHDEHPAVLHEREAVAIALPKAWHCQREASQRDGVLHQYSTKMLAVRAIISHTFNIGRSLDSVVRELQSNELDSLVSTWFRLQVAVCPGLSYPWGLLIFSLTAARHPNAIKA